MEKEHSLRARNATEQVSLWIQNDGEYFSAARALTDDVEAMARYLREVLLMAQPNSAAYHVAQNLAPNDYGRIHWDDIAQELKD